MGNPAGGGPSQVELGGDGQLESFGALDKCPDTVEARKDIAAGGALMLLRNQMQKLELLGEIERRLEVIGEDVRGLEIGPRLEQLQHHKHSHWGLNGRRQRNEHSQPTIQDP